MSIAAVAPRPWILPPGPSFWGSDGRHTRTVVLALLGLAWGRAALYFLIRSLGWGTWSTIELVSRELHLSLWALILAPLVVGWAGAPTVEGAAWRGVTRVAGHALKLFFILTTMWALTALVSWTIDFGIYPSTASQILDGWLCVTIQRLPDDLILYAAVTFWTVSHRATQRLHRESLHAAELEADLSQSQLELLQSRLQPHFLYNTLHTIASAVDRDAPAARSMLARLGDLLRATLRETAPLVELRRELQILDAFLEIQRIRFGDRLVVEYEIEPGLESILVPPLLLQPVAENAVRHALEREDRAGRVGIRAARRAGRLILEISDNGEGFRPARREGGGIGLSTTRARLERLFPGSASLDLERLPGQTRVTFEIPVTSVHSLATVEPRRADR